MRISESTLKQIIKEEVRHFLAEAESFKRMATPHLRILKYYSRFLNPLEVKDLNDENLGMAKNLRKFFDKQNTQEFLVNKMNIDPKILKTATKPLFVMHKLGGANSEAVSIMLQRAKSALEDVVGYVEDKYFETDNPKIDDTPKDTQRDDVSTKAITNKKSNKPKRQRVGGGAYSLREEEMMQEPMPEPIKPMESTGLIEQVADTMEMIKNKKQNMIDAGGPETAQEVESAIDQLEQAFYLFQSVLAQHVSAGEQGIDVQQQDGASPISEADLPPLDDIGRRKRRKERRDIIKKRGEERRKELKDKEQSDGK